MHLKTLFQDQPVLMFQFIFFINHHAQYPTRLMRLINFIKQLLILLIILVYYFHHVFFFATV